MDLKNALEGSFAQKKSKGGKKYASIANIPKNILKTASTLQAKRPIPSPRNLPQVPTRVLPQVPPRVIPQPPIQQPIQQPTPQVYAQPAYVEPQIIQGRDGITPIKGVDYFDGRDGKDGIDGKDGKNGKDGKDGKRGPSGVGISGVRKVVAGTNITIDETNPIFPIISSGGGGVTVHSDLTNLAYADSGHTGFAPALGTDDNYVTDAEKIVIGNTSGTNSGNQTSIVGISGTTAQFNTANTDGTFAISGGAFHDGFSDFVANEHIDWTGASAGTIHATNYVDNNTTYTAGTGLLLVGTQFSNNDTGSGAVTTHLGAFAHADIAHTNRVALDAVTNTNTGDNAANTSIAATKLDDFATPDDNTDLNANTTNHGLLLKATAPAAGLYNYVGITNGETAYTNKALFDATAPSTQAFGDSAVVGTAAVSARRDHKHAMMSAPTTVTGSAGSLKSPSTTGVGQLTGMGAGTTRVYTVPDANATLLTSGGALGTPSSGVLTNCTGLTNAGLSTTAGHPGGAWTTWSPSFTNFTVGSATVVARYQQVGKTVRGILSVTLAANSAMTGSFTFSLPVTGTAVTAIGTVNSQSMMTDIASTVVVGQLRRGTTTAQIFVQNAAGTYTTGFTATSSTVPFTWANTHVIETAFEYEAA